jgi:hypothetical protein
LLAVWARRSVRAAPDGPSSSAEVDAHR